MKYIRLLYVFLLFLFPISVLAADSHPQLGERVWVAHSGELSEKIDILFIPWRFSDMSSLPTIIDDLFNKQDSNTAYQGLFDHPPFNTYRSRFNISFINQNINESTFGCFIETPDPNAPPKWNLDFYCNNNLIKQDYSFFSPDFIVLITDLPMEYHAWGGEIQYLNKNMENLGFTFTHEFAHQLGLADEYGQGSGQIGYWCGNQSSNSISTCYENYLTQIEDIPNLDKVGCPKWCQSYNLNILLNSPEFQECAPITDQASCLADAVHCNWYSAPHPFLNTQCIPNYFWENIGVNCRENSECHYGTHYGQLAFSSNISIMGGGAEFNQPSINHFTNIFGCCFPYNDSTECNQFRTEMSSVNPNTDYYMKIAYNKISSCGSDALTPTPTLSPTPTPIVLPGDANNDNKVDGLDYAIWVRHYNVTTTKGSSVGDFNNDKKVDGIDYAVWLRNYGITAIHAYLLQYAHVG